MKQVRDGFLYLLRSIAGYLVFYGMFQMVATGQVTGIPIWVFLLIVLGVLELLGWLTGRVFEKAFGYDPLFMFRMPILAYALYRMALEFIFLIFLVTILQPRSWLLYFFILLGVGILYGFGVLRHWFRMNRMMLEGGPPDRSR